VKWINTVGEKVLLAKKQAIEEGAVAVARGEIPMDAVTKYRREIKQVIKALPADISKNKEQMVATKQIERSIRSKIQSSSAVTLPKKQKLFTDEEARRAIVTSLSGCKNFEENFQENGVPRKTLFRYVTSFQKNLPPHLANLSKEKFSKYCEDDNNFLWLVEAVREFVTPSCGRKRTLDTATRDTMALTMEYADCAGMGYNNYASKAYVLQHCATVCEKLVQANGGEETAESLRLKNLKASPKFMSTNFRGELSSLPGANGKIDKVSSLSQKRAAAASPDLGDDMLQKFIDDRWLDVDPDDIYNLDEWGVDPNGKHMKTYNLYRKRKVRRYRVQTGEHAPFWVSIVIAVTASGVLLPPLVIHKGSSKDISLYYAMNLHPSIGVTKTKSGYASRVTFRGIVDILRRRAISVDRKDSNESSDDEEEDVEDEEEADVPKQHSIVYMDAHDSHFDAVSHRTMLKQKFHCRFLKANDSIHDQPLDMGVNAMLTKKYNRRYSDWTFKNPGEPITVPIFNEIFSHAWSDLSNDPNLQTVIKSAFKRACLYPLVNPYRLATTTTIESAVGGRSTPSITMSMTNVEEANKMDVSGENDRTTENTRTNKEENVCLMQSISCNTKLAQAYSSSEKSKVLSEELVKSIDELYPVKVSEKVDGKEQERMVYIVRENSDAYGVVMKSYAMDAFQKSWLTPAQENAERREAERKAKKKKTKLKTKDCLNNPSTTRGLVMSKEVIEDIESQDVVRQQRAADKQLKDAANEEKKEVKGQQETELASTVDLILKKCETSQKRTAELMNRKLTLPYLKAYYKKRIKQYRPKECTMPSKKCELASVIVTTMEKILATSSSTSVAPQDAIEFSNKTRVTALPKYTARRSKMIDSEDDEEDDDDDVREEDDSEDEDDCESEEEDSDDGEEESDS